MAVECMAVRAADALLRALGKDEVALHVPMTTANGAKTGLGLTTLGETVTTLQPVMVHCVPSDAKAAEIVTSREGLERAVAESGAQDAESLLASVTAIEVNGKTMRVANILREYFGGTTYLWTIEARE